MWSAVVLATHYTTPAYVAIPIVVVVLGLQIWRRRSGRGRGPFGGGSGPFGGQSGPGNP